ncbi:MAG: hypothetical protein V2A61_08295 [Calditrichota bacterium]
MRTHAACWLVGSVWGLAAISFASEASGIRIVSQSTESITLQVNLDQLQTPDSHTDSWSVNEPLWREAPFSESGELLPAPAWTRFIVIPSGKKAALRIKNADSKETLQDFIELGKPLRLRNLQLAPLIVHSTGLIGEPVSAPVLTEGRVETPPIPQWGGRLARLFLLSAESNLELEISFIDDLSSSPQSPRDRIPSPAFQRVIESLTCNPPPHRDDAELIRLRGYNEFYLFVLPADINENLIDNVDHLVYRLMEWKLRSGNKVDLLRVEDARRAQG